MADKTLTCESCQATIYEEHIRAKKAGKIKGRLLCPMCVNEHIREQSRADVSITASGVVSNSGILTDSAAPTADAGEEPLTLVDTGPAAKDDSTSQIRVFNNSSLAKGHHREDFQRNLVSAEFGATRCRTFHAKLTDGALSFMDEQINDWVDAHPEIHVKFATSTIGLVEAKQSKDHHVIVTVFY